MKKYVLILLIELTATCSWGQTCSGSLTSTKTTPCLNQPFTLTTAYQSGTAIVNWEVSENLSGPWSNIGTSNINQFSGFANFTITPSTSGVYYYRAVLPSCTYAPLTITVGTNPPPTPPVVVATTTCPTVTLTVSDGGTNTIAWYENQGFSWSKISGQTGTSLVVAHPTGGSSIYKYYAVYENPSCASSASNEISVQQYGIAPYVSTATSAEVNFVYNSGNGLVMQKDNCNKLLLSFEGSGNNRMKGNVTIDGTINSYNGQPYLQRHYDLNPAPNATYPGTPATYSVRLFFTQAEFDAFNAATSSGTPKLPREPNGTYGHFNANGNFITDPTNSEIYYGNSEQVNLRVLKAAGEPVVAGGGPDAYNSVTALVNPANCSGFGCAFQTSWNSNYQVWQVTLLNLTSFSGFFITTTNATALPVTWASFTVRAEKSSAVLDWETSFETKNHHFEIERSRDARSWEIIGQVAPQRSDGQSRRTYQFVDAAPGRGIQYYRLKQVDVDGTANYSRIQDVTILANPDVVIGPVPTVNRLTIRGIAEPCQVQILDMTGRTLLSRMLTQDTDISLGSLAAGVYLIRLTDAGGTITQRFVKE